MNILTLKALSQHLAVHLDDIEHDLTITLDRIERVPFIDDQEEIRKCMDLCDEYVRTEDMYYNIQKRLSVIEDSIDSYQE